MKKLLAIILFAVLVLALSACAVKNVENNNVSGVGSESSLPNKEQSAGNASENGLSPGPSQNNESSKPDSSKNAVSSQPADSAKSLSRDEAINKALQKAGVKRADVRDLEAELDRERGGIYWEVDFESGKLEYSYDINAETGEVVKVEREIDD